MQQMTFRLALQEEVNQLRAYVSSQITQRPSIVERARESNDEIQERIVVHGAGELEGCVSEAVKMRGDVQKSIDEASQTDHESGGLHLQGTTNNDDTTQGPGEAMPSTCEKQCRDQLLEKNDQSSVAKNDTCCEELVDEQNRALAEALTRIEDLRTENAIVNQRLQDTLSQNECNDRQWSGRAKQLASTLEEKEVSLEAAHVHISELLTQLHTAKLMSRNTATRLQLELSDAADHLKLLQEQNVAAQQHLEDQITVAREQSASAELLRLKGMESLHSADHFSGAAVNLMLCYFNVRWQTARQCSVKEQRFPSQLGT